MIIDIFIIIVTLVLIFSIEGKKFPFASIVFIVMYIIYIYTGTIMMNYDINIEKNFIFEQLQFIVRGGFFSMLLAYFLSVFLLRRKSLIGKENNLLSNSKKYSFYFISIIVILISSIYIFLIPSNPLLTMITNPSNLAYIRESATATLGNFGFFNNFISFFLPMVWLIFLFMNKKVYLYIFLLNLILLMSTGQKSPIVYLLFLLFMAISLKNRNFSYSKSFLVLLLIMISLLIIVILQNWHLLNGISLETFELAWNGLKRRIFYGGVLPISQYLEFFPTYMEHYYLNYPPIPPDQLVYTYAYPETGIKGTVNTISLGNFYAAFGNKYIVFLLFFLLSFSIFIMDKILFNKMKDPFWFTIYTVYLLLTIKLVITDWYSIVPQFFILTLSFIGAIYLIEAFLYKFASNKNRFIVYAENKYFVFLSIAIFAYFFQGQIRGLLHG
ncbi:hypothetical protein [Aliarcobacter butzleri]|uniref:hypothetical protein n=1 Tax=Aliarcobacter butzleri TaxID=28197 RepID=UPI002B248E59|nr:hypothetical protein [Aliarcobacter butzleri]